jgi:hypothetical protein
VDPEFVLLLAYAIAFAPIAMPQVVAGLFGLDPMSPAYRRKCLRQLLTLVAPDKARVDDKATVDDKAPKGVR